MNLQDLDFSKKTFTELAYNLNSNFINTYLHILKRNNVIMPENMEFQIQNIYYNFIKTIFLEFQQNNKLKLNNLDNSKYSWDKMLSDSEPESSSEYEKKYERRNNETNSLIRKQLNIEIENFKFEKSINKNIIPESKSSQNDKTIYNCMVCNKEIYLKSDIQATPHCKGCLHFLNSCGYKGICYFHFNRNECSYGDKCFNWHGQQY